MVNRDISLKLMEIEKAIAHIHFAILDIRSFDDEASRDIEIMENHNKIQNIISQLQDEIHSLKNLI